MKRDLGFFPEIAKIVIKRCRVTNFKANNYNCENSFYFHAKNKIIFYIIRYILFFCFSTVLKESGYNNIYFRIKEIRILFDFCTECNQTQRIFLEEFTKMDTSAFCLAHIFTFRDFPAGIQGLAYKGQVCSRSHNTGFTTFLNHKVSIYSE